MKTITEGTPKKPIHLVGKWECNCCIPATVVEFSEDDEVEPRRNIFLFWIVDATCPVSKQETAFSQVREPLPVAIPDDRKGTSV